ncbi:unnamed protein product, partial [Pylaiella littoralis]
MEEGGNLYGEVIRSQDVTRPQPSVIMEGETQAHEFLRLLHGVDRDGGGSGDEVWWTADEDEVMARLRLWSYVAGNDYSSFPGVGPVTVMDVCLRQVSGGLPTLEDIARALAGSTRLPAADVRYSLETSVIMSIHPVVYPLGDGKQQHLSGCSSTDALTKRT